MRRYSDVVLAVLKRSGWFQGRDVLGELKLPPWKKTFSNAQEIYRELGLLKLEYIGREGTETIYFDVDNSEISKNMRAETFGVASYLDPTLKSEPDFEPDENPKWTELAEKHVGSPCARFGILEDRMGFNLYVTPRGAIYFAHGEKPEFMYRNYVDFLNSMILGDT